MPSSAYSPTILYTPSLHDALPISQQRWLMRLLPIGFTVFLLNFPAGLFMYWITSNVVTLVQNYVIYNHGPGRKTSESKVTAKDLQAETPNNGRDRKSVV